MSWEHTVQGCFCRFKNIALKHADLESRYNEMTKLQHLRASLRNITCRDHRLSYNFPPSFIPLTVLFKSSLPLIPHLEHPVHQPRTHRPKPEPSKLFILRKSRAFSCDLALLKHECVNAQQYATIGRPLSFEAAGPALRDCGDKWRTYLAEELVAKGEGRGFGVGRVEKGDGFEEAGVKGAEVGEVEVLLEWSLLVCEVIWRAEVGGTHHAPDL